MNSKKTYRVSIVAVGIVTAFLLASSSRATVVADVLPAYNDNAFSVSATDAADASLGGTVSFTGTQNYGSSAAKVIDGGVYGGKLPGVTDDSLCPSVGNSLILNLAPKAAGWDVEQIVVLTGVSGANAGRSDHSYTIALSTNGVDFGSPIINVNDTNHVIAVGTVGGEVQVTVRSDGGQPLGTGIKAVKFVFGNAYDLAVNIYREIDVLTSPEVIAVAATGTNYAFSVSATDLAAASQGGTVSFIGTQNYGSSAAKLIDGSVYGGKAVGVTDDSLCPSVGNSLTLNLAPKADGWTVGKIVVLTGISTEGRTDHSYTIALSTNGVDFGAPIINVNDALHHRQNGEVQQTVQYNNGAMLGTGIKAVKFVFGNAYDYAENAYREIDVLEGVVPPTVTAATGTNTVFSVSGTDLADASQGGTVSFTGTTNYTSSAAKLIDGSVYGGAFFGETAASLCPSVGNSLTLNLAPNAAGWTVEKIVVLTGGWGQEGRTDHSYTIALSTNGVDFGAPIININDPLHHAWKGEVQQTVQYDDGPLGTGIKAVKFVFGNAYLDAVNIYREIDVIGPPMGTVIMFR